MSVTYTEYLDFGYSLIPENEFMRYSTRARLFAAKYTNGFNENELSEDNRRGICELADLFYSDEKQINKPLLSVTNGKVTEMYGLPSNANVQTVEEKAYEILKLYFSREQLYRGV